MVWKKKRKSKRIIYRNRKTMGQSRKKKVKWNIGSNREVSLHPSSVAEGAWFPRKRGGNLSCQGETQLNGDQKFQPAPVGLCLLALDLQQKHRVKTKQSTRSYQQHYSVAIILFRRLTLMGGGVDCNPQGFLSTTFKRSTYPSNNMTLEHCFTSFPLIISEGKIPIPPRGTRVFVKKWVWGVQPTLYIGLLKIDVGLYDVISDVTRKSMVLILLIWIEETKTRASSPI